MVKKRVGKSVKFPNPKRQQKHDTS